MARYMKGTVNNVWDRHQDKDETPVRTIELVPDTDDELIRKFANAEKHYRLWREPETLRYLKRLAAQLDERGITGIFERSA